jgi:hypothetical protein
MVKIDEAATEHMGQISQPQPKNAAAGENRNIGPFMRGPLSYMYYKSRRKTLKPIILDPS